MKIESAKTILKQISNQPLPLLDVNLISSSDELENNDHNTVNAQNIYSHDSTYNKVCTQNTDFDGLKPDSTIHTLQSISNDDIVSTTKTTADILSIVDENHEEAAININQVDTNTDCVFKVPWSLPLPASTSSDGCCKNVRSIKKFTADEIWNSSHMHVHENDVLKTPHIKSSVHKLVSPHSRLKSPAGLLTPFLHHLGRNSPSRHFSLDILSTPSLLGASKPADGNADFLSIIDDDYITCSQVERKIETYHEDPLNDDDKVTDFILEIADDFQRNAENLNEADTSVVGGGGVTSVICKESEKLRTQKGQNCKKMPAEIEEAIQKQQKMKAKKKPRKRRKVAENKEDSVKRRVQSSGRRTRSLLRAAKELGIDVSKQAVVPDEE